MELSILVVILQFLNIPLILCDEEIIIDESSPIVKKEFLRSYYSLTVLASTEETIYNDLIHSNSLQQIPASLEWYLEDYLDSCKLVKKANSKSSAGNKGIIAGHPLLAYRMLYRYVIHLRPMIDDFKYVPGLNATLQSRLNSIEASVGWPERADVENAMVAILRLQHVYDLNIAEFVMGTTSSSKKPTPFLQAVHCFEMGSFSVGQKHFDLAVEWLEFAQFLIEGRIDETIDLGTINYSLASAISTHDVEWDKQPNYIPQFFTAKIDTGENRTTRSIRQKRRTDQPVHWRGQRGTNFNTINFWELCSGADLRTEEEKLKLYCWYDSKSNPAWFINPLKIEQLGITPRLLQIYEVLPNNLIEKLIEESQHRLIKSQVYSIGSSSGVLSVERTSLNTWLDDSNVVELTGLPKQIERITGLVVLPESSAEMIQVATYTFGGHYEVHQDVFKHGSEHFQDQKGERMATFMIYLSDVDKGGYTAFPQAGIAARPVKNSAVFWYNLKRNGQVDENTWHGACPVLQGSKWVANKWIRTHDQFLDRPCSLDSEE